MDRNHPRHFDLPTEPHHVQAQSQGVPYSTRKILDDRYLLHQSIGEGRYAKVTLATDLNTQKQVAVKILKVDRNQLASSSKEQALLCLETEIKVLERCTQLKLSNVVRIKNASFDGTIVKELCADSSRNEIIYDQVRRQLKNLDLETSSEESRVLKRQHPVCYYVMNFAQYGELYQLIEMNENLSSNLIRYLYLQLLRGMNQLHNNGFVHGDIKPENLLIDKNLNLVIADFNFAVSLESKAEQKFSPLISRHHQVGSETYNAPEMWSDDSSNSVCSYDGVKADIFAAGATLFLLSMKMSPFRRAQLKDPYYKRLAGKDKRNFWKIYEGYPSSAQFRDLFEKMIAHHPGQRLTMEEALSHSFLSSLIDENAARAELQAAFDRRLTSQQKSPNDPCQEEQLNFGGDFDEYRQSDEEAFESLRRKLLPEIEQVSFTLCQMQLQKHTLQRLQFQQQLGLLVVEKPALHRTSRSDEVNASYEPEIGEKQYYSEEEKNNQNRRRALRMNIHQKPGLRGQRSPAGLNSSSEFDD